MLDEDRSTSRSFKTKNQEDALARACCLLFFFTGDGQISADFRAPGEILTSETHVDFARAPAGEKWRQVCGNPRKLTEVLCTTTTQENTCHNKFLWATRR